MSTARRERWQLITVPKVHAGPPPALGTGVPVKDAKPIKRALVEQMAKQAQHGACVEHVRVPGLRKPVCITRGQDAATVVAAAKELTAPPGAGRR